MSRRKRKLGARARKALAAAERHGVVADGMNASGTTVYNASDAGLLQRSPRNTQVYVPTEKGQAALRDGFYYVGGDS